MSDINPYAVSKVEPGERRGIGLACYVAASVVGLRIGEIGFLGAGTVFWMQEFPEYYIRNSIVVGVTALVVGRVTIWRAPPMRKRWQERLGRAFGGFALGLTYFPSYPAVSFVVSWVVYGSGLSVLLGQTTTPVFRHYADYLGMLLAASTLSWITERLVRTFCGARRDRTFGIPPMGSG